MEGVDVVLFVLRGLSFVAGAVLCYGSLFIYEDEERQVQNALEGWWVRLDDMRARMTRRHIDYLRTINDMAASWLSRIFGDKLLSLRALGVSACLSVASLMVVMLLMHLSVESYDATESSILRMLSGALMLVGLVVLPCPAEDGVGASANLSYRNQWCSRWSESPSIGHAARRRRRTLLCDRCQTGDE